MFSQKRLVIAKLEVTDKGIQPSIYLTNLSGEPQALYDTVYCTRNNMENRIKEQRLGLLADRTNAHEW